MSEPSAPWSSDPHAFSQPLLQASGELADGALASVADGCGYGYGEGDSQTTVLQQLAGAPPTEAGLPQAENGDAKSGNKPPKRNGAPQRFPRKLFELMTATEEAGPDMGIEWVNAGTAIRITDRKALAGALSQFFDHSKVPSLQRQINLYGFEKIAKGPCTGAYAHPNFLRGRSDLLHHIRREPQAAIGSRLPAHVRRAREAEAAAARGEPLPATQPRRQARRQQRKSRQHAAPQPEQQTRPDSDFLQRLQEFQGAVFTAQQQQQQAEVSARLAPSVVMPAVPAASAEFVVPASDPQAAHRVAHENSELMDTADPALVDLIARDEADSLAEAAAAAVAMLEPPAPVLPVMAASLTAPAPPQQDQGHQEHEEILNELVTFDIPSPQREEESNVVYFGGRAGFLSRAMRSMGSTESVKILHDVLEGRMDSAVLDDSVSVMRTFERRTSSGVHEGPPPRGFARRASGFWRKFSARSGSFGADALPADFVDRLSPLQPCEVEGC